jgi:hypothetical protein
MTTLVAVGCSHMAGCELDVVNKDSEYNRQNCFAARTAKNLGFDYYNLAVAGASNQFIHRKIVEFITTHVKKDEDYFFLVGWTTPGRIEIRYRDNSLYSFEAYADFHDSKYFPLTVGTEKHIIQDPKMRKLTKFVDVIFDDVLKDNEAATLAWSTQEILKNNNFKYYMINTCSGLTRNNYNSKIIDNIDKQYFYEPADKNSSYFYYCLNTLKFKNYSKYWHHYEPAHIEYSKFLIDKIKKVYSL